MVKPSTIEEQLAKHDILLNNIKDNLPELEKLLEQADSHWGGEDAVYRYYHQSFKVNRVQSLTQEMYESLGKISPHEKKDVPNKFFNNIMKQGASGFEFSIEHNYKWEKTYRPCLEAFFHAHYFLEMAVKYGKKYEKAPSMLDSGWAALLELYNIR
jgi:hypothetical protein